MKLSIVIPLYNAEKYISEAIESLLIQKSVDIEIVVIDDGSNDNSPIIAQSYPVKYIRTENRGASAARNVGVSLSTGEYVMFLDADDYLQDVDICQKCISLIENENLDFVMFSYQYYNDITKQFTGGPILSSNMCGMGDSDKLTEAIVKNGFFPASPCFKIIKKSFIEENKLTFIVGTTSEDIEWFTRVLLSSKRYGIIKSNAYVYRKGVLSSVTGTSSLLKCMNFINMIQTSCDQVAKCNDDNLKYSLYSALCYEYFILLANCSKYMEDSKLYEKLYKLRFLTKYNRFPGTRLLAMSMSILGIRKLSGLLSFYSRHFSQSNK